MTITGGNVSSSDAGGGILFFSHLTLTNVHVTGNTAGNGGGVSLAFADGVFTNCTFSNNTSTGASGGGSGGGIFNSGSLTVTNSTISGNTSAGFGGGIRSAANTVMTVTNSTISGNTANGVFTGGGIDNSGRLIVTNSTIRDNRATSGIGNGGGILSDTNNNTNTIINSTITNNSAAGSSSASGVLRSGGTFTIRNSIIAGNVGNATQPDVVASGGTGITSNGFNLIGNRSNVTFNQTGDQFGTGSSPLAPRFAPLALNGGTTQTHTLFAGSPALDAGQSSGTTTDQRGSQRPFDLPDTNISDGADIGAFEAQTAPPAAPTVSISDVSLNEGNAGTSNFTFTVSLSAASGSSVTVAYQTADGTATAPTDYSAVALPTTLTFNGGETSKTITIPVNGDTTNEPNETFFVNLLNANGATIADNQAIGTINNDDGACSYTLSPASPQTVPATSSNLNVGVTTTAGCAWTATTSTSWITINSGSSDNGNGTVNITFAANTGSARSGSLTIAGQTYTINQATSVLSVRAPFDYDGDNKTDISIFRPAPAEWWINRSTNGSTFALQFGTTSDKIVPADYTGDGKADVAFFRPSNGNWFVLRSEDSTFFAFPFGANGDTPVAGDYDGDGKFDAGVYRPSNFTWFIQRSTAGTLIQQFGIAADIPTPSAFVP